MITSAELDLFRTFVVNMSALGPKDLENTSSSSWWLSRCRALLVDVQTRPLESFLRWSDIVDPAEAAGPFFAEWYKALRGASDWESRWSKLTRRSAYGHQNDFSVDPDAAPLTVQHAYHLKMFEDATQSKFTDVDVIIEVGGGYANFARMLRLDGFARAHFIVDLPHIREVQRLFLSLNGVSVSTGINLDDGVHLLIEDDIPQLLRLVSSKRAAFVGTWSLSETPLAFRAKMFPVLHKSCDRYLLAVQDYVWPSTYANVPSVTPGDLESEGVNNTVYFEQFAADAQESGTVWSTLAVPHFAGQKYLFGASPLVAAGTPTAKKHLTLVTRAPVVKRVTMFRMLEIETHSTCNRRCASCIRTSHPDREAIRSWFEEKSLSLDTIYSVMRQSYEMGCRAVCLQHYNEPLEDSRLPHIAALSKSLGFDQIMVATNADYMTPELAGELDGVFTKLDISLYPTFKYPYKRVAGADVGPQEPEQRKAWLQTLFHKTALHFTPSVHVPSHFDPVHPVIELAAKYATHPCDEPKSRLIVNHRGQMLLCCQDVIGLFELGSVHETPIEELWYSERHQSFIEALESKGGRSVHPHCLACPQSYYAETM
jgi:radical SAM protein with 4Fe4S-binding SPASM domain